MLYGLNDICIIPAAISNINSRGECSPYLDGKILSYPQYLPLFTAPMSCIVDDKNYMEFQIHGIQPIIPRNIDLNTRILLSQNKYTFAALSLFEFETLFVNNRTGDEDTKFNICVDLANGHMSKLIRLCREAKEYYGDNLQLMTGNIANPQTYLEYAKAGIDYVRIGIGSGNVCTTSANGGIHYPMASLIQECYERKKAIEWVKKTNQNACNHFQLPVHCNTQKDIKSIPKIIADGGFKNFDQIIKALALGADYCMLGEIFAKSVEACGEIKTTYNFIVKDGENFSKVKQERLRNECLTELKALKPYREYYGMSTKRAQIEMGITDPEKLKTAEGIEKQVTVDYTLEKWVGNFTSYLRSSMSYTGSRNLSEFKDSKTEIMSAQAFNAFYK